MYKVVKEDKVREKLEDLIASVKSSKTYREYREAKEKVERDPLKKRQLDKYRTKIYEIQNSYGGSDLYNSVDRIEQESEEFRSDPEVDQFLTAELALCRMIQYVNLTLIDELDFDMEFVKEE